jgi:predicted nucleic acid-binding protein
VAAFLLDTTLLIDYVNGDPSAAQTVDRLFAEAADLFTCEVVTCEALSGGNDEERRLLGVLLDALEYVSTDPTAARWAAASRREGRSRRPARSLADALIAGVAWRMNAAVVTRNTEDFVRQGVPVRDY